MSNNDIVKGFAYGDDQYVVVTDDEFERIKSPKDKSIQILHFAQLDQISPVYYDKSYQAIPEAGGEKAFELLRRSLMEEEKVAIGRTVLGTKDTLLALIPRQDGMLVQTMFYAYEVKELAKGYQRPEVSEQELSMARTLIQSMDRDRMKAAYEREDKELRERLERLVAEKQREERLLTVRNPWLAAFASREPVQLTRELVGEQNGICARQGIQELFNFSLHLGQFHI